MPSHLHQHLATLEKSLRRGDFADAVRLAEQVLRQAPAHVEARRLHCAALRGAGYAGRALQLLEQLAAEAPDNALVQNSLGAALRERGDLDGAAAAFRRACEIAPDLAPAWYNLAVILLMREQVEEGLAAIERAVELAPGNEAIRVLRTDVLREQGRIDFVTAEYRSLIARNPDSPWGWFGLANLKNLKFSGSDLALIEQALRSHPESGRERVALLFAAAKAYEDHGRYAEAFSAVGAANAQVRQWSPWNAASFGREMQAILEAFSSPVADSAAPLGAEAIFIVGLPRSGSTLIEQILASHPLIEGAGEREELEQVIADESSRRGVAFPGWVGAATPGDWERLGRRYLELTARWRAQRPRFVDKMPGNWRFVGAALAMLPQARVVVCRRDPLETVFACYRQWFAGSGHGYSYSIDDAASYWREFDRACRAWRERFPDRVFDMIHEDLLRDQDATTRALLAFCGLDFDPACLRFHETGRNVGTISSAQVREPLRQDTARAAKYGSLLDPLRTALGLEAYSADGQG